jgi:4-diphosphocytidyl-2-C-methyl-D-erythritol kinase
MGYQAPLVIKSFAKLNLYLQILNKRKDNFHNLSTLFTRIDLADRITFRSPRDHAIKITTNSRQVPEDKTNLCYRAAALLQQEFKLSSGIEIGLKKCIPVGAGLGGGSANAASVLLGLNKFWGLNLDKKKLEKLAAKLGSDVPFFVHQVKFALGTGRGDKIKPLPGLNRTKLWFILVYPNFKVSTPLIYRKYDGYLAKKKSFSELTMPGRNVRILTSELLKKGARFDPGLLFNSLEPVTQSLYPQVKQVKKALCAMGLEKVMMSGSGPAVFAVCDSALQAKRLKSKLGKQFKRWQIFAVSAV